MQDSLGCSRSDATPLPPARRSRAGELAQGSAGNSGAGGVGVNSQIFQPCILAGVSRQSRALPTLVSLPWEAGSSSQASQTHLGSTFPEHHPGTRTGSWSLLNSCMTLG